MMRSGRFLPVVASMKGRPAVVALHLADEAGDLDVALKHAVIRVRNAQRTHCGECERIRLAM
jgi:hypothetical protein